jgi:hypothetical protein
MVSPFIIHHWALRTSVEHSQPMESRGHDADLFLQLIFEFRRTLRWPQRNSKTKDDFALVRIHPLTEVF